jgi:uncharacterized protein (DUF302 family)
MAAFEDYGISKTVDMTPDKAAMRITEELKKEGFGILTEIDVKETLKKKLDVDFSPYKILGACNPTLAYEALRQEMDIGLLLPCNVIVYETREKGTRISIMNPKVMLSGIKNRTLDALADEATARVTRALEAV